MEIRLTTNQQKGSAVQDISAAAGLNIYLTGGAVREALADLPSAISISRKGIRSSWQKDCGATLVRYFCADDDAKLLSVSMEMSALK